MQTAFSSAGRAAWRVRALALLVAALLTAPAWAANGPVITVMTRNVWSGADLDAIFAATTEESFVEATAKVLAELKASGTPDRMAAIADEIKAARPDLVALQEVALWRTGPLMQPPAAKTLYDQLGLLLDELAGRDLHYRVVVSHVLTDAEAPVPAAGVDLRYTDRDVILARADLPQAQFDVYNAQSRRFEKQLAFGGPLVGDVRVYRGWLMAEVVARGRHFYFVATHLESPIPGLPEPEAVQVAQGDELIALAKSLKGPVVLAGDLNSNAEAGPENTGVVQSIVKSGFTDSWKMVRFGDPGYTYPLFTGSPLTGVATPNERIDFVLVRGVGPIVFGRDYGVISADLCGNTKPVKSGWPSDHAGLIVKLQFN